MHLLRHHVLESSFSVYGNILLDGGVYLHNICKDAVSYYAHCKKQLGKVAYFRDIPNFSEQYYGVRDHVGMFS
jgi:hypothetical protein